jgi:hypothetical protein
MKKILLIAFCAILPIFIFGQRRIKPDRQIEKAPGANYHLLSDGNGDYQHTPFSGGGGGGSDLDSITNLQILQDSIWQITLQSGQVYRDTIREVTISISSCSIPVQNPLDPDDNISWKSNVIGEIYGVFDTTDFYLTVNGFTPKNETQDLNWTILGPGHYRFDQRVDIRGTDPIQFQDSADYVIKTSIWNGIEYASDACVIRRPVSEDSLKAVSVVQMMDSISANSGGGVYSGSGALSGPTTVTMGGSDITFDGLGDIQLLDNGGIITNTTVTATSLSLNGAINQIQLDANGTNTGTVTMESLTGDRTWTFPDQSGTIAMLSDISGGSSEFADDVFRIQDNADATKELAFENSGITTATTRSLTVQDLDGVLPVQSTTQTIRQYNLPYFDADGKLQNPPVNRGFLFDEVTEEAVVNGNASQATGHSFTVDPNLIFPNRIANLGGYEFRTGETATATGFGTSIFSSSGIRYTASSTPEAVNYKWWFNQGVGAYWTNESAIGRRSSVYIDGPGYSHASGTVTNSLLHLQSSSFTPSGTADGEYAMLYIDSPDFPGSFSNSSSGNPDFFAIDIDWGTIRFQDLSDGDFDGAIGLGAAVGGLGYDSEGRMVPTVLGADLDAVTERAVNETAHGLSVGDAVVTTATGFAEAGVGEAPHAIVISVTDVDNYLVGFVGEFPKTIDASWTGFSDGDYYWDAVGVTTTTTANENPIFTVSNGYVNIGPSFYTFADPAFSIDITDETGTTTLSDGDTYAVNSETVPYTATWVDGSTAITDVDQALDLFIASFKPAINRVITASASYVATDDGALILVNDASDATVSVYTLNGTPSDGEEVTIKVGVYQDGVEVNPNGSTIDGVGANYTFTANDEYIRIRFITANGWQIIGEDNQ